VRNATFFKESRITESLPVTYVTDNISNLKDFHYIMISIWEHHLI